MEKVFCFSMIYQYFVHSLSMLECRLSIYPCFDNNLQNVGGVFHGILRGILCRKKDTFYEKKVLFWKKNDIEKPSKINDL